VLSTRSNAFHIFVVHTFSKISIRKQKWVIEEGVQFAFGEHTLHGESKQVLRSLGSFYSSQCLERVMSTNSLCSK